jgi:rRNA maturation endonuclease Nob1
MIFTKALMFIYKSTFLNILLLILLIWFCISAYRNSLKSRKYYICPNCGESFRSEHMKSKCCKVCGTKLEEKNDSDINDNAM